MNGVCVCVGVHLPFGVMGPSSGALLPVSSSELHRNSLPSSNDKERSTAALLLRRKGQLSLRVIII